VALKDDDAGLRRAVVNALADLPIPPEAKKAAVPALTAAFRDKDAQVRTAAVYVLGQLGTLAKDTVPALTEALQDKNPQVRQAATRVLKQIDPDAAKKAGRLQ
jgi:HEAT repeat protein